jgi:hypothetical protein
MLVKRACLAILSSALDHQVVEIRAQFTWKRAKGTVAQAGMSHLLLAKATPAWAVV